jgi:GT2 family glycosyltransferase
VNRCSVVILNWNGVDYLRRFLPALIQYSDLPGIELVVADNASSDESLDVLKTDFPAVRTLVLDMNYGFAGGYNKALAQLNSEFYVLLNSDVEVTDGWLQPMLEYMTENQLAAACQPKVLSYHNPSYFEHAGASGGFIDVLGYPFCRGRVLSYTESDLHQYDAIRDVFWATGACMMVRADKFHSCGGFDSAFFAHMEEIDLCWRFLSRGFRVVAIPFSVVYHVGGGTLNSESSHKTYLNFRNNLLMLYKNLPAIQLRRVLFVRFFLDLLASLHLLLTGKRGNALAVVKACRDFYRMKKMFTNQRNENLALAKVDVLPGVFKGSILYQYYIKGKRTFDDFWQE